MHTNKRTNIHTRIPNIQQTNKSNTKDKRCDVRRPDNQSTQTPHSALSLNPHETKSEKQVILDKKFQKDHKSPLRGISTDKKKEKKKADPMKKSRNPKMFKQSKHHHRRRHQGCTENGHIHAAASACRDISKPINACCNALTPLHSDSKVDFGAQHSLGTARLRHTKHDKKSHGA
ncbi:uncharacterized protein BDZ99DRAFT_266186 [Mytilinidion resinicola]|uniref:Uncharacterized protein n=1 Tax=Mytilinidion resinicola TaxID=574789 RepID=A0A6A6YUH6_9PEZI|nr:uncharacterized protein BDZ99DRAFT_266186 [Mytilinidion resinicola]KAF2812410.1 hypothetical protein BDZ99DRAFT_266186 [Mytilinidion resinicola]